MLNHVKIIFNQVLRSQAYVLLYERLACLVQMLCGPLRKILSIKLKFEWWRKATTGERFRTAGEFLEIGVRASGRILDIVVRASDVFV